MSRRNKKGRTKSRRAAGLLSVVGGGLWRIRKPVLVVGLLIGVGLFYDYQLRRQLAGTTRSMRVRLVDLPPWMPADLARKICASVPVRADDSVLDGGLAERVGRAVATNPWVRRVHEVQVVPTGMVEIRCEFRRPVAFVMGDGWDAVVDYEGMVLPQRSWPDLKLMSIEGVQKAPPVVGQKWTDDDLQAGLALLSLLVEHNGSLPPNQRYLHELRSIDVSNFRGRRSVVRPHLQIVTLTGTRIYWGMAPGTEGPLESPVPQKLSDLVAVRQRLGGRLDGTAKIIDIRTPSRPFIVAASDPPPSGTPPDRRQGAGSLR